MGYTKGEWRRFGGMVDGYGIVSSNGEVIIEQTALNGLNNEANAHLISAAPDMYEALKDCLQLIEDMMPGVANIALQNYQILNEAPKAGRRALAKAEGNKGENKHES